jgi:hypothetical protein
VVGLSENVATATAASAAPSWSDNAYTNRPSHQTTKVWKRIHKNVTDCRNPVVHWSADGKSVEITDYPEFQKQHLFKTIFERAKYDRFIPLMRKTSFTVEHDWKGSTIMSSRISHPYFLRDHPEFVAFIHSSKKSANDKTALYMQGMRVAWIGW